MGRARQPITGDGPARLPADDDRLPGDPESGDGVVPRRRCRGAEVMSGGDESPSTSPTDTRRPARTADGPWAGDLVAIDPGPRRWRLPARRGGRPGGRAPHAGRPADLGDPPGLARAARPAVQRDGRDARAGRRPARPERLDSWWPSATSGRTSGSGTRRTGRARWRLRAEVVPHGDPAEQSSAWRSTTGGRPPSPARSNPPYSTARSSSPRAARATGRPGVRIGDARPCRFTAGVDLRRPVVVPRPGAPGGRVASGRSPRGGSKGTSASSRGAPCSATRSPPTGSGPTRSSSTTSPTCSAAGAWTSWPTGAT